MKILIIGIVCLLLSACSAKLDGFDPSTSVVRWIITHDKN
jgi:hypothetical protein